MKFEKFEAVIDSGILIKANPENKTVQEYALSWLHLTNNAREWPEIFLKHWNTKNYIYVVTTENHLDDMKKYLRDLDFNPISETKVRTITPCAYYDFDVDNDEEEVFLPTEE